MKQKNISKKNVSRKCRGIPHEKRESKPETKANKVANQVGRNRRQGVCVSRITGFSLQQLKNIEKEKKKKK
jgi:hypothetical protein